MLLGLRCFTAILILLMLWEPMLITKLGRESRGEILVSIDLSGSMFAVDEYALPDEKMRWARATGLIGNEKTNSQIDRWIEAYENGMEPEWVSEDEGISDPKVRDSLIESRKDFITKTLKELNNQSRFTIARKTMNNPSVDFWKRLDEKGNVTLLGFAQSKQEVQLDSLTADTKESEFSALSKELGPQLSDLSLTLNHQPSTEGDSRLAGVVIFTDGRDNAGKKIVEQAKRLKELNIRVFPVIVGTFIRPLDLTVSSLDVPLTAYKGDHPVVKAIINTNGFEGKEIEVKLVDENQEVVDDKKVLITQGMTEIEFPLKTEELGRKNYQVVVSADVDEVRQDNNSRDFSLTVTDDTSHVMLIDGEGRWEFRFIDSALSRDNRVSLTSILYRQPYLGLLSHPFFERKLPRAENPNPQAPEISPFDDQHLVILGDISPTHFTNKDWKLLEKFVSEGGGTLVLSTGKRFMPLQHNNESLNKLLPVTDIKPIDIVSSIGRKSPTERGFHLKLTPEGEKLSLMQFDVDPATNRSIWDKLPGHNWGMTGKAKPGTTVLADISLPTGLESIVKEDQRAMIVSQNYGFGQVIWLGVDSTWRWRHRVGNLYHHKFWGQLSRFSADYKAAAGNKFVRFGPEKPEVTLGEDVVIRARWAKEFIQQHPDLKTQIEIYKVPATDVGKDTPFSTVELQSVGTVPLIQEARLFNLPQGQYILKMKPDANLPDLPVQESELIIIPPRTLEMSDLTVNKALLEQIAEESGGKVYRLDETHLIPDEFDDLTTNSQSIQEFPLWDHWGVMILLFTLLGIEWTLRKLNGLA